LKSNRKFNFEYSQKRVFGNFECTFVRIVSVYGKNGFLEGSKNLTRYRSENNFVGASK